MSNEKLDERRLKVKEYIMRLVTQGKRSKELKSGSTFIILYSFQLFTASF